MTTKQVLMIAVLTVTYSSLALGQMTSGTEPMSVLLLQNNDVLRMVKSGSTPNAIIAAIQTSECRFDIFPPVLLDLTRRGVPWSVIEAMKMAPNGLPKQAVHYVAEPTESKVSVPSGTSIEVETAFTVKSSDLERGIPIFFLVSRPIYVKGVLAIARNAAATARVVDIKKPQRWGRPGSFTWQMESVIAVDGTNVPLRVSQNITGGNRVPMIVAGAAATVLAVFPYTSPAALLWGFKKGGEAVLPGSRSFTAVVRDEAEVIGILRRPDGTKRFQALSQRRIQIPANFGSMSASFRPSGSFLPAASFLPSGSFLPSSQR
jgi:hypothetical protein